MSLRAIKKQQQTPNTIAKRQNLFKKSSQHQKRQNTHQNLPNTEISTLAQQKLLLGREVVRSNPELRRTLTTAETLELLSYQSNNLRTKSENDIRTLILQCERGGVLLGGAKSEVCLQTITSHNYQDKTEPTNTKQRVKMIGGARSHRDLSQSTYGARTAVTLSPLQPRRMSESSLNSAYSQRTSVMSASSYGEPTMPSANNSNVPKIGIRGYEVIEERARFTVYKLRVENPLTNDCWLVLRRYTDFVRLNNKLKQAFPHIALMLPRKKIFGDNFNSVFLDNRVQGLQIFVNSVMAKDELRKYKIVREFFCLDEPPSYSESMEECRAIFEAQEETISHLKMQISSKNDLILNLQQKLRDELLEKEQLKDALKNLNSKTCKQCNSHTTNATSE